jgi:hypothetical protein
MQILRDKPMSKFKQQFPLLARHEGIWDGVYRYYDAVGQKTDEHTSRLVCRFPENTDIDYEQSNHYKWPDGRSEVRGFPAVGAGDRIIFKSDLIDGWAADVALDPAGRTTMLHWVRKGEPGVYLYEMIQISDCGQFRSRVWHWFKDGRLFQRTLIDEQKISSNSSAVRGASFAGDAIAA